MTRRFNFRPPLLWGIAFAAACGCGTPQRISDIDPTVAVLENVQPLAAEPLPPWTINPGRYERAADGTEYFLGVSFPRQTRLLAGHEADVDADARVARYVGEVAAAKLAEAGKTAAGTRLSHEVVIEEFARRAIAAAPIRSGKPAESHIVPVAALDRGRPVLAHRAYRLHGVARQKLVDIARAAAQHIEQEMQEEHDDARKQELRHMQETLMKLSVKDFTF